MIFDLITSITGTRSWMRSSESGTQIGTQMEREWNANGMQMERIYERVPVAFRTHFLLGYFSILGYYLRYFYCINVVKLQIRNSVTFLIIIAILVDFNISPFSCIKIRAVLEFMQRWVRQFYYSAKHNLCKKTCGVIRDTYCWYCIRVGLLVHIHFNMFFLVLL